MESRSKIGNDNRTDNNKKKNNGNNNNIDNWKE